MMMMHGVYNGKNPRYKGEGAILYRTKLGKRIIVAQFDNMDAQTAGLFMCGLPTTKCFVYGI